MGQRHKHQRGGRGAVEGVRAVLFLSKYTKFPPRMAEHRRGVRKRQKKRRDLTSYSERTALSSAAFDAPLLSLSKLPAIKWTTAVSC